MNEIYCLKMMIRTILGNKKNLQNFLIAFWLAFLISFFHFIYMTLFSVLR